MSYGDSDHAARMGLMQRTLNDFYRRTLDNLELSAPGPMIQFSTLQDPTNFNTSTNAKEDTMAKAKAKRRAARPRIKLIPKDLVEGPLTDAAAQMSTATAAVRLSAPTDETVQVALFITAYLLSAMGQSAREIAEVFELSTEGAIDRVSSGRMLARRMGVDAERYVQRNLAMRENRANDFARAAARAMQERIALSLPAFIRIVESNRIGDDHGIKALVKMVNSFSVDDVVQQSEEAQKMAAMARAADYATDRQRDIGSNPVPSNRPPTGAPTGGLGRAGQLSALNTQSSSRPI